MSSALRKHDSPLSGDNETIESSHLVDVTSVLENISDYDEGDYAVYKFGLNNLNIEAEFYPKGIKKSKPNYCSFFITIPNVKETDKRKLKCTIGCVYQLFDESFNPVNIWKNGRGYSSFTTLDSLQQDPIIPITLKLYNNPIFIATTKKSFQSQLHEMYKISKDDGDITLSIITDDNNNNNHNNNNNNNNNKRQYDGGEIHSPPRKKRKLLLSIDDDSKDIENDDDNNNNNNNNDTENDNINDNDNNNIDDDNNDNIQRMKVNSLVLQSGSKVFRQMLDNEMKEKQEKKITIYAKSYEDVDNMIYFLVTNILRKDANPCNIIRLAHFYEIDRLVMACLNRMIKSLNVDNFIKIVSIFDRYGIEHGYNTLVQFGKKNTKQIRSHPDFSDLSHSFKCIVLGCAKD